MVDLRQWSFTTTSSIADSARLVLEYSKAESDVEVKSLKLRHEELLLISHPSPNPFGQRAVGSTYVPLPSAFETPRGIEVTSRWIDEDDNPKLCAERNL